MNICQLNPIVGEALPRRGAPPAARAFFAPSEFFAAVVGQFSPYSFLSGPVIFGQTMVFGLFRTLPDLAPKKKNVVGSPLRDVRTFASLVTEGTSTSASRSAVAPERNVLSPNHARSYFCSSNWYCDLGNSSRIQFRRLSPSNSPLTLPLSVWITEYGTGQFCVNIFGQAVSCAWAPAS